MGIDLQQFRAVLGRHNIYLKVRCYRECFKGKFWCTMLLLFYMEAVYLPALKTAVHNYEKTMMNHLWFTQMYLYQFCIPELIRLANDIELNPGPIMSDDCFSETTAVSTVSKAANNNATNVNCHLNMESFQFSFGGSSDPKMITKARSPYLFIPCRKTSQSLWCSKLCFPLIKQAHIKKVSPKQLCKPVQTYTIKGDGNCLFRALSYLITGCQSHHAMVRTKIIEHMKSIETILQPHISGSVEDYLARSKMALETVWGTDIEILTAASLLKADIFVYTKVGSYYTWQRFSESVSVNSFQQQKECLYLNIQLAYTMMLFLM